MPALVVSIRMLTPKLSFREVDNNNWCDFERLFAARRTEKLLVYGVACHRRRGEDD